MTAFWVISALLVAGTLLFVVPPLLAKSERRRFSRSAANISIRRDQLRELDADRASGTLDAEHYEKARRELEARLLEDLRDGDVAAKAPPRGGAAAIAAGLAIPLVALGLYFTVGNPQAVVAEHGAGAAEVGAEQMEPLVARLAQRMAQEPEDAKGWVLLARSYQALGRLGEAAEAYRNAVARLPDDVGLLADYAHVVATAQGPRPQGEAESLLARALEVDPNNLKALALAGSVAFKNQDYAAAAGYWERMLPFVPQESDTARFLQERIAEARSLGGGAARVEPPKSLGDLKLLHASQGTEALQEINRLHGKDLSAEGGYVAHYEKEGAAAMVYLAQASSPAQAALQINQMRARIQRGDTPFSGLKTLTAAGTTLYSVLGQGQTHYFYRQEANVLWLAADAPVAKQSLAALVGLSTTSSRAAKRPQE